MIYKLAMAFWINIYGCQPHPRNSHLCSKTAQKPKLLLGTVILSTSSLLYNAGKLVRFPCTYNVVERYISTMSRVAGARLAKLVTTPQRRVSILSK